MEKDIKEYLEKQHWVKFLTRDIPFIRNAIIINAYVEGYKKDIGWHYNPGVSIFKKGIAHIYRCKEGTNLNAEGFLKIKNKKEFFERIIKETKSTRKKTLENIKVCENKLKNKKLEYKELLNIFNLLYATFKDFWNFQFFPMGLEFSLNGIGKQDVVLKYEKYMVDIREQSQYITVKLEDLIDIVLKRIAKSKNLSYELIKYTTPTEIINNDLNRTILNQRKEISVQMVKDNKYLVFQVKEAKEIDGLIISLEEKVSSKEVKGSPAYKGKAGGLVRVILYRKDLGKIKKGEILVTPMTEAFYTPYLKRVEGIITNEGGITCHAAIISREMKIPCIIGTRNATKILETGDLVEVNANDGIVKIIKKAG
ncbi:hypothetical protein KKC65_03580 [Patescibacteria group bacterium]|nr:hypothetical protein [Patescibacteria group bacterium]